MQEGTVGNQPYRPLGRNAQRPKKSVKYSALVGVALLALAFGALTLPSDMSYWAGVFSDASAFLGIATILFGAIIPITYSAIFPRALQFRSYFNERWRNLAWLRCSLFGAWRSDRGSRRDRPGGDLHMLSQPVSDPRFKFYAKLDARRFRRGEIYFHFDTSTTTLLPIISRVVVLMSFDTSPINIILVIRFPHSLVGSTNEPLIVSYFPMSI